MDIYETIENYLAQGKEGVLGTIVKKTGATPQVAGAKIFIGDDGKIFGTVGGGCVEAEVWEESRRILQTKDGAIVSYVLSGVSVEDDGMICGGNIDIFLEPVFKKYRDLYRNISYFQKKGKRAVNITHFGDGVFSKTLLTVNGDVIGDGTSQREEVDKALFYAKVPRVLKDKIVEPVLITSTLYIYGAGHISQFISKAAKSVDFNVIVMDDRVQFANRERFPEADEIIVDEFENIPKYDSANVEVYSVIVTRGHKHDALVLGEVLKRKNRYVGMIGSKRKINMVFDYLQRKGFDKVLLKSVHAPIGLDINSETPQEIALSIVAELVKVRGEKRG